MRRKQHLRLQPRLRWGPERGRNLAAAPALIDTLLSVGREARRSCISQHMWPVNQGSPPASIYTFSTAQTSSGKTDKGFP